MRVHTVISDLTKRQWDLIQREVKTSYDMLKGATRVCVVFEHGELERHAEMPMAGLIGMLVRLVHVETDPTYRDQFDQLPVLPTADQVRNLSAKDAVALAAEMNKP